MNIKNDCNQKTNLPKAFRIQKITRQNSRTLSVFLEGSITADPGQFVMVWLPDVGEKPFSISGIDPLRLTIVNVGPFSQAIHALGVGDRLWIRGPLGHGFHIESGKKVVMAGGGYGAAPLLFLGKELVISGCDCSCWLGARSSDDIILADEMRQAGIDVNIATEDGSLGIKGLVTTGLKETLAQDTIAMVYACGPARMLQAVAEVCKTQMVPCQLSWEALMRCGMGLCGSCELEAEFGEPAGWLVCMDGPISHRT
jgi:dihydroorotate dehydrogenase electron transfer subunit